MHFLYWLYNFQRFYKKIDGIQVYYALPTSAWVFSIKLLILYYQK